MIAGKQVVVPDKDALLRLWSALVASKATNAGEPPADDTMDEIRKASFLAFGVEDRTLPSLSALTCLYRVVLWHAVYSQVLSHHDVPEEITAAAFKLADGFVHRRATDELWISSQGLNVKGVAFFFQVLSVTDLPLLCAVLMPWQIAATTKCGCKKGCGTRCGCRRKGATCDLRCACRGACETCT